MVSPIKFQCDPPILITNLAEISFIKALGNGDRWTVTTVWTYRCISREIFKRVYIFITRSIMKQVAFKYGHIGYGQWIRFGQLGLRHIITTPILEGILPSAWNLVGWLTVPWSRSLFKNSSNFCVGILGIILHIVAWWTSYVICLLKLVPKG